MASIRILPEILSNKIAAGEVVERPASVVKELVENALDAAGTDILIEISKGGKALIRVSDNGIGMHHDDALLCLERYATSKIFNDHDLFAIETLGFRGEALPSIASVSKFNLVSRDATADVATEVVVAGGTIKKVSETGAPPGTSVTVRHLFYNTPARRKFLKTVATEFGHIADTIAAVAMGWPQVRFRLDHNGHRIKNWPAVADPIDRVIDIWGKGLGADMCAVRHASAAAAVSGWVLAPRVHRSTSRGIFTYVNGRFVRDRVIQHALFAGYAGRLMKGRYPLAVMFITVPHDQVDVNVHPTKHQIKFFQQKTVHETVQLAVGDALRNADRAQWGPRATTISNDTKQTAETVANYHGQQMNSTAGGFEPQPYRSKPPAMVAGERFSNDRISQTDPVEQLPFWQTRRFADLRVIGQLHNTYILCESQGGLILIDQHAAHERVFYEQLKRHRHQSAPASQQLLVPETLELGFREADILKRLLPDLQRVGFAVEPFGGNTFAVKAVPALLAAKEIKPAIIEVAEKIAASGLPARIDKAVDAALKLIACHGVIRAHQPLARPEMQHLLQQLDACENPSHCPHGRPTFIEWSNSMLEKAFGRKL